MSRITQMGSARHRKELHGGVQLGHAHMIHVMMKDTALLVSRVLALSMKSNRKFVQKGNCSLTTENDWASGMNRMSRGADGTGGGRLNQLGNPVRDAK